MLKRLTSWMLIVPVLSVVGVLTPVLALGAEGISAAAKLEYAETSLQRKNLATNVESETDSSRFRQLYTINLYKEFFPFLGFKAGGLFEAIDATSTTDRISRGFKETVLNPFVELNLANPLHQGSVTYRKTEINTTESTFPTRSSFRELYTGYWNWQPQDFPTLQLNYDHSTIYNDPETRNSLSGRFNLKSRYAYKDLSLDYTYTTTETEDLIQERGSLNQIHDLGARYTKELNDRLTLDTGMRLTHSTLEQTGAPNFLRPTSPGAPSYLLDDSTPDTNTADEFTAVDASHPLTVVNIGRDGPLTLVSVSLAFGSPTAVDTLYVRPLEDDTNPDLASPNEIASVAGSFVWRVFFSDDEENWTEQSVTVANYDIFDNRFEISFSSPADTQYVKISTTPLSVTAPGEIRVANVQSLNTVSGAPGESFDDTTQHYNMGLQWDISDKTSAQYDFKLNLQDSSILDGTRVSLRNGAGVRHRFNTTFSTDARVLRTDNENPGQGKRVNHTYSASLRADYLDTFRQALTYSGSFSQDDRGESTTNSILLRSNPQFYENVSFNLDLGYTWETTYDGTNGSSTYLRASTNIKPHRRLHFTLDYSFSLGAVEDEVSRLTQIAGFQFFWIPLNTLSLIARIHFRDVDSDEEQALLSQNYTATWAPFPDGALNIFLTYTDRTDSAGRDTRTISPGLKWRMTRWMNLKLNYTISKTESEFSIRDLETLRATLQFNY